MKSTNLSSIRVLYVEDDLETREELQFILENYVGELYIAKNGREGLALYREHLPDIVITDIQMPEMNGLSMSIEIKALNAEQSIVIMSAHDDSEYLFHAMDIGIKHYLTKPIRIERLLHILDDITELKQILQKLQYKEHMLFESQRIAHIGSWSLELATDRLIWSDETYRMFGVSQETFEPTLKGFLDLIYPDDLASIKMWLSDCLDGKSPVELNFRITLPDGAVRILCGRGELQYDEMKRPLHIMGSAQDITERKQTEARLNAIFHASVDGIICYDIFGNIESTNIAVETIFGYKQEELIGYNINKIIPSPAGKTNKCDSFYGKGFAGQIIEFEGIHKNGSMVALEISIIELPETNGKYFASIIRNVSLRKHREQQDKAHLDQLAHVTRLGLMGEMASGIAHEVNQPLSAISTYTQVSLSLINTENPDLIKLNEILFKTQQQALRAGGIIHRMKDFGKGHSQQHLTTDINALIYDATDFCITEFKHNNIKLNFELTNNLPPVVVDHVQIEQVIINLVRNSIDALLILSAEQPRCLTIQSHLTSNNEIQVRVKDNGSGLNEDQQKGIFMPFYTTKTNGMGMGLSISRSLIEAHKGSLRFNSKIGKGTTFYFTLPIKKEEN